MFKAARGVFSWWEMSDMVFFRNSFSRFSLAAWAFNTAANVLTQWNRWYNSPSSSQSIRASVFPSRKERICAAACSMILLRLRKYCRQIPSTPDASRESANSGRENVPNCIQTAIWDSRRSTAITQTIPRKKPLISLSANSFIVHLSKSHSTCSPYPGRSGAFGAGWGYPPP